MAQPPSPEATLWRPRRAENIPLMGNSEEPGMSRAFDQNAQPQHLWTHNNFSNTRSRAWLRGWKGRFAVWFTFAGITIAFTIVFGLTVLVQHNQHRPPTVDGHAIACMPSNIILLKVLLFGGIRAWDFETKTLAVRFIPHYFEGEPPRSVGMKEDMFFFMNADAFGKEGFNSSNAVLSYSAEMEGLRNVDQFIDVEITENARAGQLNVGALETDVMYPFDWYLVRMIFAATGTDFSTRAIIGANIFNSLETQWVYDLNFTYLDGFKDHATKLTMGITIRRSTVTKLSAILIVILNWAVTLGVLHMVITYVVGRRQLPDGLDSVALPFAGLFALPSVRSVMPGNPPFDFIGIIPNLAILASCATVLLVCRIHRETRDTVTFPEIVHESMRKEV
ncbi:hypothetical protein BKA62DRAFT_708068 [Auriculariales sp. MPI-PUGE-AT-0066]|nr:hypothetical protein BKA62DRAFT_708068 [Auriculariales sp. MPI-PUGE-AT-0066]